MSDEKKSVVLVVEDELSFRENVREFLEECGYIVLEAEDGQEGLEVHEKGNPDVVLLDLRMPKVDGLDVLAIIKERTPDTPIIILSGKGTAADAVEALQLGACDYLFKPIENLLMVQHAIEYALERARLIRENRAYQEHLQEEVDKRTVELEEANQGLRESEEKFRILTENLKDVIFSISPIGILTDLSGSVKDFGGYDPSDGIGSHISNYIAKKSELRKALKLLKQVVIDKKSASFEFYFKPKEGRPFPVEVTGKPLLRKNKVVSVQCSMRDIRDRKKAEEERQKLQEQLRQAQKMEAIGTLSGGIAHDFNNLLTVIKGHAGIGLMKVPEDHEVSVDFYAIIQAAKRAENLTKQLLTFSRKQVYEPRVLDINQLITDLEKMLRRLISEDIDLRFRLAADAPLIKADPGQIEQVLMNLIVNARDAIRDQKQPSDHKQVTIETHAVVLEKSFTAKHPESKRGRHLLLVVTDSGMGMHSGVKEKIFEPFFTTKSKHKGTGLGLSTVYGIVRQNTGIIEVFSKQGQGTTFKIYWPATRKRKKVKEEKEKTGRDTFKGNETILLVEDEDAVRSLTRDALERLGYKVFEASNGKKALEFLAEKSLQIDLLLTDLIMPEMNGMQLVEKVEELYPGIEVLYASGYTDDQLADAGALDESIHFIHKPYSVEALAKKVRCVLDSQ